MQVQFPSIPASTSGISAQPDRQSSSVDFQSFLRLLTAQLQNQDPLSPLESTQFVAQLASFTTVEQLVSANSQLGAIAAALAPSGIEQYAALVGKIAEFEGAPAPYNGVPVRFRVDPRANVTGVEAVVRTIDGEEIYRASIENGGGENIWPGLSAQPGNFYRIDAEFTYSNGSRETVAATLFDTIVSVRETQAGPTFTLSNGLTIPRDAIRGIGIAPAR